MKIIPWKLPLAASWTRSLELKELSFSQGRLVLLLEEEQGAGWQLAFSPVQAFRSTTEECAASILQKLPEDGGLFEVLESPWIEELGRAHFLADSHHYVVCCYDEVVEVVAWNAEATGVAK
jgi:hypothetical protein